MGSAVVYLVILFGAMGSAMGLYFGLRAAKLI